MLHLFTGVTQKEKLEGEEEKEGELSLMRLGLRLLIVRLTTS